MLRPVPQMSRVAAKFKKGVVNADVINMQRLPPQLSEFALHRIPGAAYF